MITIRDRYSTIPTPHRHTAVSARASRNAVPRAQLTSDDATIARDCVATTQMSQVPLNSRSTGRCARATIDHGNP